MKLIDTHEEGKKGYLNGLKMLKKLFIGSNKTQTNVERVAQVMDSTKTFCFELELINQSTKLLRCIIFSLLNQDHFITK